MKSPTHPETVTRDGVTYRSGAVLRHPDGSLSVRYIRTGGAPARRPLITRITSTALSFFV